VALASACCSTGDPSGRSGRCGTVEEQGVPSLASHTHGRHVPHVPYAVLRRWDRAAVNNALAVIDHGEPVDIATGEISPPAELP
jgi:hypothetical protein